MRVTVFLILLLTYSCVHCQNLSDIENLFKEKKYNEAMAACNNYLKTDTTNASIYDMKGRCYNGLHQYSVSILLFEKAIAMDRNATYLTGWAYCDMGVAHIATGDTAKGCSELYKTVELGHTPHSVSTALNILKKVATGKDITGDNSDYEVSTVPNWVVIESTHIKYLFEDTVGISYLVQKFVAMHDKAFDTLNAVFEAKMPVKISFYVWLSEERAQSVIHCPALGFATPESYTVNTRINQTIGHEMTHVLSYWAWGTVPANRSKFINEGLAVAFDLAHENKIAKAKRAVAGKNLTSVLDIWKEGDEASGDLVYPVGGAFMQFLYLNGPLDDFKKLIKEQTILAAKRIYGKQIFNDLVERFNKLVGLD